MATLSLAGISTIMSVVLQDQLVNQFRSDVLLPNLLRVRQGAGPNLSWPVKIAARTAGGPYAEGADMADGDYDSDVRQQATLNWAQYRKGAKISGLAAAAARSSGGPSHYGGMASLWDEEIADAVRNLGTDLNGDFYAGNHAASPTELAGAALAIEDADDNFAGIDTGNYPTWNSAVDSIVLADVTFDALRTGLFRPVRDATGRDPHFVTVPGAVFDVLRGKFQDSAETLQSVRVFNGNIVGIEQLAGARAISLDGVPFIEDRACTTNRAYAWNADAVEIVQLPADIDLSHGPVMQAFMALDLPMTEEDVAAMLARREGRLIPTIEVLGKTGDAYKAMVKAYLQLKWLRRNAFSKVEFT